MVSAPDRGALPEEVFAYDLLVWSHEATCAVCRLLRPYYREVTATQPILRPSLEMRVFYRDEGDIWALTERVRHRFEVKRRKQWSGGDFPWPSVIVDELAGFRSKYPRPRGYFICDAPLKRTLYIASSSFEQWFVERKRDRRYQDQEIDFLLAPTSSGTYWNLEGD